MNTKVKAILKWLDAEYEAEAAKIKASKLELKAHNASLPKKLREATADDIVAGNIIWYKHGDEGHFWQDVAEVRHPNDAFKAYVASDGCCYGLDDAWVEL